MSGLIATTAVFSFTTRKYKLERTEIHPGLRVLFMRVGQSYNSPPFHVLYLTRHRFFGLDEDTFFVVWAHVHHLQYVRVLRVRAVVDPAAVNAYARSGGFGATQQEKCLHLICV